MKYLILTLAIGLTLSGCNQKRHKWNSAESAARMDSLKNELLKTDISFSQLCDEKGRNTAFIEYADSNATMLRPYSMPLTGRDTIIDLFKAHPDSLFKLSWVPIHADVAHSGELGYTFGTYSLEIKGSGKEEGTYCTVWKKNRNHQWKFILDTGNEGLTPADKK